MNNSKQKREKTSSIFMNIKNAANFYLLEDIPKPSLLPEIAANGYVDVPIKQAWTVLRTSSQCLNKLKASKDDLLLLNHLRLVDLFSLFPKTQMKWLRFVRTYIYLERMLLALTLNKHLPGKYHRIRNTKNSSKRLCWYKNQNSPYLRWPYLRSVIIY